MTKDILDFSPGTDPAVTLFLISPGREIPSLCVPVFPRSGTGGKMTGVEISRRTLWESQPRRLAAAVVRRAGAEFGHSGMCACIRPKEQLVCELSVTLEHFCCAPGFGAEHCAAGTA